MDIPHSYVSKLCYKKSTKPGKHLALRHMVIVKIFAIYKGELVIIPLNMCISPFLQDEAALEDQLKFIHTNPAGTSLASPFPFSRVKKAPLDQRAIRSITITISNTANIMSTLVAA